VPLSSQVPLKLQIEAEKIYGVDNNHVGTLTDEKFLLVFNRILYPVVGKTKGKKYLEFF